MMGLNECDPSPTTVPLYGFTRDHVIPKSIIKLVVMVGEHLRVSTAMTDFLILDCPSASNGVIGRPLLKALKEITFIYHLTMKFPTIKKTGQVKES